MTIAEQTVVRIRRSDIRPLFQQPRESFDYDRLVDLAESMRERGQLQPVIVRATGDKTVPYDLVDGERRWRAAELAQIDSLLAVVSSVGKGDDHFIESVVANSAREDLTPLEQSRAVARIAAMDGYDPSQKNGLTKLAAVFGRSTGWVTHMLKLDHLAPEVKALVEERKLSPTAAAQLAEVKSPERQAEIGKRVAERPMRSSAAMNAVRNAVRVEQVREGRDLKPVPGTSRSTGAADRQLVAELVGRATEATESVLDLPVARLRAAYADHPKELAAAVKRARDACAALEQLRNALLKLTGNAAK